MKQNRASLSKFTVMKMKRLIVIFTFLACFINLQAQELISDAHFQRGLTILNPTTGAVQGNIQWTTENGSPIWECGQWSSKSTLAGLAADTLTSGWMQWANADKIVRMGPTGAENYDLYLGMDSNHEYGGVYRAANDPWPALLVQQRISPPGSFGPGCLPLSQLSALNFHVEAKLDTAQIIKKYGYNSGIHAAQFLIYFTVQNLNHSSSGYGHLLWLGVQVYDDRYPKPPKYVNLDPGTSSMIYSMPYEDVADTSMHSGKWVTFQANLLPHAIDALHAAWSRGYLLESRNLADYKIGGMNMGWEMPGLNYAAVKVRNLSLVAEAKTAVERKSKKVPTHFKLLYNYPNPFNASTIILYELEHTAQVKLAINNLSGRQVALLEDGEQNPGRHHVVWNARHLSTGVYQCILQVGNERQVHKLLLLK